MTLLLDVSRDFHEQAASFHGLDAVLLTHAHRDAAGGLSQLVDRASRHGPGRVAVYGHPDALTRVRRDHRRAARHVALRPVTPRRRMRIRGWSVTALEVPHGGDDFPTLAWRVSGQGRRLVYASDVARLTEELQRFCRGVDHLVLDGATWRRRIFSHLRVDQDLPVACKWSVDRIWLTQIGRSVPPHEQLDREARELCPRASPAYDGLVVTL